MFSTNIYASMFCLLWLNSHGKRCNNKRNYDIKLEMCSTKHIFLIYMYILK